MQPGKEHWETVYTTKATDEVSWFQPHAQLSLDLIKAATADKDAGIIDVGGGASTLVDDLLAEGYRDLTCARSIRGRAARGAPASGRAGEQGALDRGGHHRSRPAQQALRRLA